jgi:hypothetical protein
MCIMELAHTLVEVQVQNLQGGPPGLISRKEAMLLLRTEGSLLTEFLFSQEVSHSGH